MMNGLVLKDFFTLKSALKTYLMVLLFFTVVNFSSPTFLPGFVSVFVSMLPISAIAYDERAKFYRYALTMPVSCTDLVISKYLLGAGLVGVSSVLSFLVLFFINRTLPVAEKLSLSLVAIVLGLLYQAIILPIIFKFGSEKGRMYMMAIFMLPIVLVLFVANLKLDFSGILSYFQAIAGLPPYILIAIPIIILLAIYFGSIVVSIKVMRKKEW